ncbi:MAG: enoyl-CoA hydratase/isomerase family protein [Deltaproteobacteria bacterium]|nr:enoyl-CoA hydratase/isomerase family protein [Deltaproteobacteria bacterium]
MAYENILYEVRDGVGILTLNRPEVYNSLNAALMTEVRDLLPRVAADPGTGALVITGAGDAFCSGADLTDAGKGGASEGEAEVSVGEMVSRRMIAYYNPFISEIFHLEKPVIAAVNGVAAGGGVGLALTADVVVAGRSAYFMQVFGPRLGLVPDCGCTWYVPRLVGSARALGLALFGEKLPAEEAARWGLIWKCVDDGALMDEVMGLARQLAEGPTKAFGYIKRAFRVSERNDLDAQLDYERLCQRALADTQDFMEGVTAFLEKRKPEFKGR